jgi:hypothetical protein
VLYEDVLPNLVLSLTDGHIPYHRGSPYGGLGWDTVDPTVGDIHQWDVWAGKMLPWQRYGELGGHFVRCVRWHSHSSYLLRRSAEANMADDFGLASSACLLAGCAHC